MKMVSKSQLLASNKAILQPGYDRISLKPHHTTLPKNTHYE